MKQVLQNISNGETVLSEVPCPQKKTGFLLIATKKSLVSVGTERSLVEFGKSNWLQKAMSQPDKVKMVLEKVKTDGLAPTIAAVRSKLDQPLPLGYCNVGIVQDRGNSHFEVGARVVSNGNHAEIVRVPKNLCAAVPENVDDESAAFTVLAAIAMQGVRIANPTIGETVVVTGLGLIGLISVQILRANGCRVLGIDYDSTKCALAREFGAETVDLSKGEDPLVVAHSFSRGRGVDAVIITASTKSNEPVSQGAGMCRKRGRVVLVGVVGLELSRADFYMKEISFQVSCSYGPGRYDEEYEEKGKDYPVGFVRWTEQRNFEAVLDLMASGQINVKPLISHRFEISDAIAAYECLNDRASLGILLNYQNETTTLLTTKVVELKSSEFKPQSRIVCGFVGAGNYASRILIPAFKLAGATLDTLVTSGGVSAVHHGAKNGFVKASTDFNACLNDENVNTLVIATQHNSHASQVLQGLQAGKHIFVEKPLALTHTELTEIESSYYGLAALPCLMVGYNRRFAPHIIRMKQLLKSVSEPKTFILTMNAGAIPADHWTQNPEVGGGRIIGEACHYIDLLRYLVGHKISDFCAMSIGAKSNADVIDDKSSITLSFVDGSIGTIHYFANGGKAFPKERIEVFAAGAVLQLDNFRSLKGFGWKGFNKMNLWQQDKGQQACVEAFLTSIKTGAAAPIEADEIFEVARISIDVAESLRQQK